MRAWWVIVVTWWSFAAVAHADRVLVEKPHGNASVDRLSKVDELIASVVQQLGHQLVRPSASPEATPTTESDMGSLATRYRADYVVVTTVTPMPGQYRLLLRVGYPAAPRVEEFEVNVVEATERAKVRDVLAAMLRPSGLGDDALRLSSTTPPPRDGDQAKAKEAERAKAAAEQAKAKEAAKRAKEADEQAKRREALRADVRKAPWTIMAGLDARALIARDSQRDGQWIGAASLRVARSLEAVPSLQLRGGVELFFGATSAFTATAGSMYGFRPFAAPITIGGSAELGLFQGLSGSRSTAFVLRGAPVIDIAPVERLVLEFALPELMWVSGDGGVVTLGASVRLGWRF